MLHSRGAGVSFNGWTHNSDHFLAMFASYEQEGVVPTPLLSIASIVTPALAAYDATPNTETHREVIRHFFGKTLTRCVFLCGDYCPVNKRVATLLGIPLVVVSAIGST